MSVSQSVSRISLVCPFTYPYEEEDSSWLNARLYSRPKLQPRSAYESIRIGRIGWEKKKIIMMIKVEMVIVIITFWESISQATKKKYREPMPNTCFCRRTSRFGSRPNNSCTWCGMSGQLIFLNILKVFDWQLLEMGSWKMFSPEVSPSHFLPLSSLLFSVTEIFDGANWLQTDIRKEIWESATTQRWALTKVDPKRIGKKDPGIR